MQRFFLALLVLAGCDAPDPETIRDPGTITVMVEGVTGADGLLLITEAKDENGNQAAISCIPIDADPFSATFEMEEVVGPTPCEESGPIELVGGTYDLLSATLAPGEMEPRACAEAVAEVDGDVTVDMPSLGACD